MKAFKKPSKKHQPKGLTFIYEDKEILVVDKTNGLLTISTPGEKEKTAYYMLSDYVKKGNSRSKNKIFIVHRLDRDTSGVIVFAKNINVKKYLQQEWDEFSKVYYAVVHGSPKKKQGVLTSYLAENNSFKVFSVNNPGKGRFSQTAYKVIQESRKYSLLEINLMTGRKHQIRVQLADAGHPVVGDKKYGIKEKGNTRLCLHAHSLTLLHPFNKEEMTFETELPPYFESLMNQ